MWLRFRSQMTALSTRVSMRVKPAQYNWQANGTRPVTQYSW